MKIIIYILLDSAMFLDDDIENRKMAADKIITARRQPDVALQKVLEITKKRNFLFK